MFPLKAKLKCWRQNLKLMFYKILIRKHKSNLGYPFIFQCYLRRGRAECFAIVFIHLDFLNKINKKWLLWEKKILTGQGGGESCHRGGGGHMGGLHHGDHQEAASQVQGEVEVQHLWEEHGRGGRQSRARPSAAGPCRARTRQVPYRLCWIPKEFSRRLNISRRGPLALLAGPGGVGHLKATEYCSNES